MSRRALLAAALGALAAACTDPAAPAETIGFRQPAALAIFRGLTLGAPDVRPYLAVANAGRNDLTLVNAADDTAVWAPVQLRALVLPVPERPALLASASLGDDPPPPADELPDLLVAVSAGDSVLQVVATWDDGNAVFSDPATDPVPPGATVPLAVDLGADVLAIAAVPSAPGTARVAAALAGGRVAVVEYARVAGGTAIVRAGDPIQVALGFQPVALAALPDDPDLADVQTAIYAASLEPVAPGVLGVAELSPDLSVVRPLRARGPTRLVAAARLRERRADASAPGPEAFDPAAPSAPRVYAVLDESGCGVDRPIDCGVVTVDPQKALLGPDDDHIPEDWAGRMPYRAPIPIPGRALALAVAPPPAETPDAAHPEYADSSMRLHAGAKATVTTAVAAVASSDGRIYFLDLGRFKAATASSTLVGVSASVKTATPLAADATSLRRRLWVQDGAGAFAADDLTAASATLGRTPGWTRTADWRVTYQGVLPDLGNRWAEARLDGTSRWLALQVADGAGADRRVSQVVKVWHPWLGVRATDARGQGDLVEVLASTVDGCAAALAAAWPESAGVAAPTSISARVDALLPPTPEYPGGALRVAEEPAAAGETPAQLAARSACFGALGAADARVNVSIRARGLVLTSSKVGYAGRPAFGAPYALAYPAEREDAAAGACPLLEWDGAFPPPVVACDEACRDACERAMLARKTRRVHHNFEDCTYDVATLTQASCEARYPGLVFPVAEAPGQTAAGPALAFRVGLQERPADDAAWIPADPAAALRDLALVLETGGGDAPLSAAATSGAPYLASGAIAFDRSASAGYRFLVSYTSDLLVDTSPHVNPPDVVVVR